MSRGVIVPASDYINFDDYPYLADRIIKNIATVFGKQWGIPGGNPYEINGLMYNMDIRDREGIPDPMELDLADQWDWDDFVDLMKAVTKDFNGDGIIDQWGYDIGTVDHQYWIASNKGMIVQQVNGRFEFTIDNGPALRAIAFISDLVNTYKVANRGVWPNHLDFPAGKAFCRGSSAEYSNMKNSAYAKGLPRLRCVKLPRGPDNYDDKVPYQYLYGTSISVIPATSKQPAEMAKFLADFVKLSFDKSTSDLIYFDNATQAFPGDPEAVDYWMRHRFDIDSENISYGGWGSCFKTVMNWIQGGMAKIIDTKTPIITYLESIKPSIQAEIDDVAGQ
jgi:ABC-type glycerol-3-phosphate transport system substrate-binding protein